MDVKNAPEAILSNSTDLVNDCTSTVLDLPQYGSQSCINLMPHVRNHDLPSCENYRTPMQFNYFMLVDENAIDMAGKPTLVKVNLKDNSRQEQLMSMFSYVRYDMVMRISVHLPLGCNMKMKVAMETTDFTTSLESGYGAIFDTGSTTSQFYYIPWIHKEYYTDCNNPIDLATIKLFPFEIVKSTTSPVPFMVQISLCPYNVTYSVFKAVSSSSIAPGTSNVPKEFGVHAKADARGPGGWLLSLIGLGVKYGVDYLFPSFEYKDEFNSLVDLTCLVLDLIPYKDSYQAGGYTAYDITAGSTMKITSKPLEGVDALVLQGKVGTEWKDIGFLVNKSNQPFLVADLKAGDNPIPCFQCNMVPKTTTCPSMGTVECPAFPTITTGTGNADKEFIWIDEIPDDVKITLYHSDYYDRFTRLNREEMTNEDPKGFSFVLPNTPNKVDNLIMIKRFDPFDKSMVAELRLTLSTGILDFVHSDGVNLPNANFVALSGSIGKFVNSKNMKWYLGRVKLATTDSDGKELILMWTIPMLMPEGMSIEKFYHFNEINEKSPLYMVSRTGTSKLDVVRWLSFADNHQVIVGAKSLPVEFNFIRKEPICNLETFLDKVDLQNGLSSWVPNESMTFAESYERGNRKLRFN